jgi:16S rRNA (guanine966-N2)-methyltransferase
MLRYIDSGIEGVTSMRVIAGKYRGRTMRSLRGMDIRPTSDRLRETLFNVLTAGNPDALQGTVWLDLFAGTGAVGIEAISRGARQVYFGETSPAAVRLIEKNLERLGISDGYKIQRDDVTGILWRLKRQHVAVDVAFLDPPYGMVNAYKETLTALAESSPVWAMTLVIAEHDKKFDPGAEFAALRRIRLLVQGDSALSFYRIGGQPDLTK